MGLIAAVTTKKKDTVMGIDASTKSLAFAIYENNKLKKYGKIEFAGRTVYDRLTDAQDKLMALREYFEVDYIAIEKPVRVNSASVAIKLAMFVGVIIASVNKGGTEVVEVYPMSWQAYIGNNNYTRAEKAKIKRRRGNSKKTASAISAIVREERKQFTMTHFNKMFKINVEDNDVGDAIGVGWYAVNNR